MENYQSKTMLVIYNLRNKFISILLGLGKSQSQILKKRKMESARKSKIL